MNENRLSPLPQYHIDRDKLCEIVKETIGYDTVSKILYAYESKIAI